MITQPKGVITRAEINGWEVAGLTRNGGGHIEMDDQDAFAFGTRHVAVFDGMGGHAGGKAASRAAVTEFLAQERQKSDEALFDSIANAVQLDTSHIVGISGTTGTIARLGKNGKAWVGGVGDTPALAGGVGANNSVWARQLLKLEELPDGRTVTNALAGGGYYRGLHQRRNVRSAKGEVLVIGSDGALDSDTEGNEQLLMQALRSDGTDPGAIVQALFEIAKSKNFPDDFTVVAARFMGRAVIDRQAGLSEGLPRKNFLWAFPDIPEIIKRRPSGRELIGVGGALALTWALVNGVPGFENLGSDGGSSKTTPPATASAAPAVTMPASTPTTQDPQIAAFFAGDGATELDATFNNVPVYAGISDTQPIGTYDIRHPILVKGKRRLLITCPGVLPQPARDLDASETCWINRDGRLFNADRQIHPDDTIEPSIKS